MAGHKTTLPITLNEMIYHGSSVMRAVQRSLVVVDMPFGTYQGNSKEALHSAIRIMKEAGVNAVKLEGGEEIVESVDRILSAGIPVLGHLGLTPPQSINKFGTYVVRATEEKEAEKLRRDAKILEQAGCFGIVLEKKFLLSWQLKLPNPLAFQRLASAQAIKWTARCLCCTICWASTPNFHHAFCVATTTCTTKLSTRFTAISVM